MVQILRSKQIVLVPFPFSDQTGLKRRPALIISNDGFNETSDDVIVCAITSNVSENPRATFIKPDDWKDGLYSESCVIASDICTIDKRLIIKTIGRLSTERFGEVLTKIYETFKINQKES